MFWGMRHIAVRRCESSALFVEVPGELPDAAGRFRYLIEPPHQVVHDVRLMKLARARCGAPNQTSASATTEARTRTTSSCRAQTDPLPRGQCLT